NPRCAPLYVTGRIPGLHAGRGCLLRPRHHRRRVPVPRARIRGSLRPDAFVLIIRRSQHYSIFVTAVEIAQLVGTALGAAAATYAARAATRTGVQAAGSTETLSELRNELRAHRQESGERFDRLERRVGGLETQLQRPPVAAE